MKKLTRVAFTATVALAFVSVLSYALGETSTGLHAVEHDSGH